MAGAETTADPIARRHDNGQSDRETGLRGRNRLRKSASWYVVAHHEIRHPLPWLHDKVMRHLRGNVDDVTSGDLPARAVSNSVDFFKETAQSAWFHDLKILLGVLSFFLFVGVLYLAYLIYELHHHEVARLRAQRETYSAEKKVTEISETWEAIMNHLSSANPSDWKLAILEADIMLDEMIRGMAYPGENLGERLKIVRREDMQTLDLAWEAHKVRNRIAHDGARFEIDQTEARRVLGLYGKVFGEFKYISE